MAQLAPYSTTLASLPSLPVVYLHCAIFLAGGRMLNAEQFRLINFSGQESSSELFDYQLELHGDTDGPYTGVLEFEELMGRPITVGINYPGAQPAHQRDTAMGELFAGALRGGAVGDEMVLFNGIISGFGMSQPGVYQVTMKPALHRLTLSNDYRVYPINNVRDTIEALMKKHRLAYSIKALTHPRNPAATRTQNWLQAGESDFDFLKRLMNKAHLYFYFVHTGNTHTIVFANHPAYPPVFTHAHPMRLTYLAEDEVGLAQSDTIFQYSYQRVLTSSSVQGILSRQHASWEEDWITPIDNFNGASRGIVGELPFHLYKIQQYGGSAGEVHQKAVATSAAMHAAAQVFSGASYCAHFRVGHQFAVADRNAGPHGASIARPALDKQNFVLTLVKHEASADGLYRNEFQAAPATGLIASYSMQETQQGSVLAVVVARAAPTDGSSPQDWRYYTAAYVDPETNILGDSQAAGADKSLLAWGVFVRLSTEAPDAAPVWVKLAPHMQNAPEPGVTVLIARAQDESELPEIQSIVHSTGTKVVIKNRWTASSHVGNSYSTSYGDGRSVRFGANSSADLVQANARVEQAYDSGHYRESSYSQGASYSFSCSESQRAAPSDLAALAGKYPDAPDLLSASESFGSTYSSHKGQVASSRSEIGTSYNVSVTGRSDSDSLVTGLSTSVATHDGDVESVTRLNAASRSTADHYGDVTSTTTHHGNATVDATTTINGDSYTKSTISGINSSDSKHAISVSKTVTGVQMNTSATLLSNTNDLMGASNRISVNGATADSSATLSHTSVSVSAQSNTVQMVGENNVIELLGPGLEIRQKGEQVGAATVDLNVTIIVAMQIFL